MAPIHQARRTHACRSSGSRAVPWSRPRHELLLLLLVGAAALSPIYVVSSQDVSRLCLSRSLVEGRLAISGCVGNEIDRARYGGRIYSDKAPGMSLLALPASEAIGLPSPVGWTFGRDARVWAVRLLTGGAAFLLMAFAVGRVSEGLASGAGGLALVTFALATPVVSLAATMFDHVTAGALGLAAFLFAWRGRSGLAGLLAGVALATEYQSAIVLVVLGFYIALRGGRPFLCYLVGLLPGGLALAGYNWAAFGSPLHLSYGYVANRFARSQASGFFGVSLPRWQSFDRVLFADRGLLVTSPVVLMAAIGLALLARRHRLEALACAAIVAGFLLLSSGYFLPYGGVSPGPRFFVPALPFLALGLGPAFARFRLLTTVLAVPSLIASLTVALTWSWESSTGYRQTVWGELIRTAAGTGFRLRDSLASNVLTFSGLDRPESALVIGGCALLAFALALSVREPPAPQPEPES
jgi:hypothetical protein